MRHPSIPGCVSQGKNEAEEEKNIQEAIKACLESAEKGMPLTVTTRQVEVLA
ncbi:MAG TPA: type II toxin-antitoxin system HicB family antitoxin [Candidatus Methanoperedens sp.]|nr:type II toxin-antitoxin system HicB family antitoxin [Candidatus Methanoperedens sp.]